MTHRPYRWLWIHFGLCGRALRRETRVSDNTQGFKYTPYEKLMLLLALICGAATVWVWAHIVSHVITNGWS